jgi:hypothetical protein
LLVFIVIPWSKLLVNTFCSSLGSTLLFIKSTTIHPLYLWVIKRTTHIYVHACLSSVMLCVYFYFYRKWPMTACSRPLRTRIKLGWLPVFSSSFNWISVTKPLLHPFSKILLLNWVCHMCALLGVYLVFELNATMKIYLQRHIHMFATIDTYFKNGESNFCLSWFM